MLTPVPDPAVLHARRARFAKNLGGVAALVPSGRPRPRNYPANVYPFRASSHFLYLAGLPLPNAWLLLDAGGSRLFVDTPSADDAIWHGEGLDRASLHRMTGCRIHDLSELPGALEPEIGVLWPPDAATTMRAAELVGRSPNTQAEPDTVVADAVIDLRLVHDAAAADGLRRAAEATVAAHRAGMRETKVGGSESAVRAAMEAECRRHGMGLSYPPIVTVRGEVLHNEHQPNPLKAGDLLLADVGAETPDGWAGDVTRTWPVSARFSTTQKEIYEVVRHAQSRAIERVRPGVRYRDVHLTAAQALAEGLVELRILRGDPAELVHDGVHALFFPHGIGHLLGLDVHDMEDLGDRAGYAPGRTRSKEFGLNYLRLDRDLAANMAVTIEPGFYQIPAILEDPKRTVVAGDRLDREVLAKFGDVRGIRIEDDVLVTEHGAEVMTDALPKRASDVEAAVG